jgi:hypothetical protein
LQPVGIVNGEKAIVEAFITDFLTGQLTFSPLMTIKPDAQSVGRIGTKLDERGSEVFVQDIEVVVVDKDALSGEAQSGTTTGQADFVGAKALGFLLGNADHYNTVPAAASGFLEVALGDILFTLFSLESDDWDVVVLGKLFDFVDEAEGHLSEQSTGRDGVFAMDGQEVLSLAWALKVWNIAVEVDAIDAFAVQRNVGIE